MSLRRRSLPWFLSTSYGYFSTSLRHFSVYLAVNLPPLSRLVLILSLMFPIRFVDERHLRCPKLCPLPGCPRAPVTVSGSIPDVG